MAKQELDKQIQELVARINASVKIERTIEKNYSSTSFSFSNEPFNELIAMGENARDAILSLLSTDDAWITSHYFLVFFDKASEEELKAFETYLINLDKEKRLELAYIFSSNMLTPAKIRFISNIYEGNTPPVLEHIKACNSLKELEDIRRHIAVAKKDAKGD